MLRSEYANPSIYSIIGYLRGPVENQRTNSVHFGFESNLFL